MLSRDFPLGEWKICFQIDMDTLLFMLQVHDETARQWYEKEAVESEMKEKTSSY